MARTWLILLLVLVTGLARAEAFIIGVPPIHSMRTLAQRFEPLRVHLAARLQVPVYLESAPNFALFHQRTLEGGYDLAITPSHFGRLAEKEQGFQPLAQFEPDHDALLVCRSDRPIPGLEALKYQQLAVIDRLAVTVMASIHYLEAQGLEAGRDYRVAEYRNHGSMAQAVASGMAPVGVTTTQGMKQLPESMRERLKVLAHIADIPAFVVLAKPQLPSAEADRLQGLVLEFGRSPAGQRFLEEMAYAGLRPADEKRLRRVDTFLKAARQELAR